METKPTVYVVDDDAAARQSLEWLLSSVDLKVQTFESAEEFLADYVPGQPGCLLLDERMPGMSGLELVRHRIAAAVQIPIILITGHADVRMAVRAMQGGVLELIEKPIDPDEVIQCVRFALERDAEARAVRERQVLF